MGHSQITGGGLPNWFDPTNLLKSHQRHSTWFPEVKSILKCLIWTKFPPRWGKNDIPVMIHVWISCGPWESHSCREEFLKCKYIFLCFLPPHPFVPQSHVTCELIIAFSSLCEDIRRLPSLPKFSKSATFSSIGRHLKSAYIQTYCKALKKKWVPTLTTNKELISSIVVTISALD